MRNNTKSSQHGNLAKLQMSMSQGLSSICGTAIDHIYIERKADNLQLLSAKL